MKIIESKDGSPPLRLADDIHELPWFNEVLEQSEAFLHSLPFEAQPFLYRQIVKWRTE